VWVSVGGSVLVADGMGVMVRVGGRKGVYVSEGVHVTVTVSVIVSVGKMIGVSLGTTVVAWSVGVSGVAVAVGPTTAGSQERSKINPRQ
jgi:hypothetical protein